MSRVNSSDWKAYNQEIELYRHYGSQGISADMKALEAHIAKLREVAPKDKAGWLDWRALYMVEKLENDLAAGKAWLGQMPSEG
ncbi:hypothetical protein ES703_120793 [subsurface metagenome]